jgi:imidazole glycerol-phosphate synthase subunit HisH
MITIVDYRMGNLGSISNMLKKIGQEAQITADPALIAKADKLVLPGVGAFDAGMDNLERSGLIPLLNRRVLEDRVPTLGICLGMQLMTRRSEEGAHAGLGWIDAEALCFRPANAALKVPHMGWNRVMPARPSALTDELPEEPRFYFVHSFYVRCYDSADVLLTTPFGEPFASAFQHGNVWGVQFHPEKSHKFGMALLRNFAERVN